MRYDTVIVNYLYADEIVESDMYDINSLSFSLFKILDKAFKNNYIVQLTY